MNDLIYTLLFVGGACLMVYFFADLLIHMGLRILGYFVSIALTIRFQETVTSILLNDAWVEDRRLASAMAFGSLMIIFNGLRRWLTRQIRDLLSDPKAIAIDLAIMSLRIAFLALIFLTVVDLLVGLQNRVSLIWAFLLSTLAGVLDGCFPSLLPGSPASLQRNNL